MPALRQDMAVAIAGLQSGRAFDLLRMQEQNMSTDTITWLVDNGWSEYKNGFKPEQRCFYKRFDTPTRCACNDDKPGIQIEIAVTGDKSFELELIGQLRDGTWLRLLNYYLPKDVQAAVALIPRLLKTWEAANK